MSDNEMNKGAKSVARQTASWTAGLTGLCSIFGAVAGAYSYLKTGNPAFSTGMAAFIAPVSVIAVGLGLEKSYSREWYANFNAENYKGIAALSKKGDAIVYSTILAMPLSLAAGTLMSVSACIAIDQLRQPSNETHHPEKNEKSSYITPNGLKLTLAS